jgi:hypothetical protein
MKEGEGRKGRREKMKERKQGGERRRKVERGGKKDIREGERMRREESEK